MYIVVFKARLKQADGYYFDMADRLRKLAFENYNCQSFETISDGELEVAVSRWRSLEDIQRWKADPIHQSAQRLASDWYRDWKITIAAVEREYQNET